MQTPVKSQLYFGLTLVGTVTILLVAWKRDPGFVSVPSPGKTLVMAVGTFLMASVLIFSANIFLALAKGKKAKSEQELEDIMVPAMRAEEYDARIMQWTELPRLVVCGVCLGALCAFGLYYLIR